MTKTLLLTGATGGVAQSLIELASAAQWRVVAVSRQPEPAMPAGVTCLQADVSTPEGAASVFAQLSAQGIVADSLAHMAGSTLIAPFLRTKSEQYRAVMAANLDSAFFMLQGFIAQLRAAERGGSAVLASSVVAQIGTPNHEAIAAAKAGVDGLVRATAASFAAYGIRVNAVSPGLTETGLSAGITRSPAMREAAAKQYPLQGINSAADVARVAWMLLGDDSLRVTGQVWAVDGGFTAIRPMVR